MKPNVIALAIAGALVAAGCASKAPADTAKPSYQDSNKETVTATVEAVDLTTRMVTLRGPNGTTTFKAGPEVRNLPQVHVGDLVKVDYYESLALEVKPGDGAEPSLDVAAVDMRAEPGQKPGAATGTQTTATAIVEAIDRENSRVTLRGPRATRVLKVKDPAKLKNVVIGDKVVVTYTEALAVSVEPQAPAK